MPVLGVMNVLCLVAAADNPRQRVAVPHGASERTVDAHSRNKMKV